MAADKTSDLAKDDMEQQTGYKRSDWYLPDITEVGELAREVLEKYSHISPDEVVPHVLAIRERAWKVWNYPCIGGFRFLDLSIAKQELYPSVLERLRTKGETFLDLGCCFAQDLRKLVFDGAPPERLYGSDLRDDFIKLGYELFKDKETLKSKFITGDVFDFESPLKELHGKVDIIYAASFFHLFDWPQQVAVAKRMVALFKPTTGCVVFGRHRGSLAPGDYQARANPSGKMYRHNAESFQKLWKEIGDETGTEWKVTAVLHDDPPAIRPRSMEDRNARGMTYQVEKV